MCHPRRNRCREHSADEEGKQHLEIYGRPSESDEEAGTRADRDDEFRRVHRADHARRRHAAGGEECGCGHGPPATTSRGIDESSDETQGDQEAAPGTTLAQLHRAIDEEPDEDVPPEDEQQGARPWPGRLGTQSREHRRPEERADSTGDRDA